MVRVCAYPRCFNQEKRIRTIHFHRLPLHDPFRLRRWLMALRLDLNSTIDSLRSVRVCGEHFSPEDYRPSVPGRKSSRPLLKSTAVPTAFLQKTEDTECPVTADQVMAAETLEYPVALFAGVPHSPSVEQRTWRDSSDDSEQTYARIRLLLRSPGATGERTCPSTSGIYHALPPTWSYQTDIKEETEEESLGYSFEQDVGMAPADVPSDDRFVPPSPASTSTPPSEENKELWTCHERKWLVNESKLMQLFTTCHQCGGGILEPRVTTTGSLISINWECTRGHSRQWSSCPDVRGMPENDLLMTASTLFSGATHTVIADWADLLNLHLPEKTTFYSIQSSYLIPVIDTVYKQQHTAIMERLLQTHCVLKMGVHVPGDGRSDSPGFSSNYNTYSFVDDATDQVILSELVPVTEATSSAALETIGFRRGLDYLLGRGVEVEVVTTDRSPSIRKILQEDYPSIHHEFDIWLVVKGLMKKLQAVSNQKNNQDLQPWIKSICNHLWYACATCGGDTDDLIKKWQSLLHHICGIHCWEEDGEEKKCQHDDLSPEQQRRKRWLRKDSPAFKTLSAIVLDQDLMKDMKHMALFKHTDKLEAFHSLLQKYTQKGLNFAYPSMRARTQLAIMEHNQNVKHEQASASTSTGNPRLNGVYPKQTRNGVARQIYAPAVQTFRQNLVSQVLQRSLDPTVNLMVHHSHVSTSPTPQTIKEEP